jgi:hypothetical protein
MHHASLSADRQRTIGEDRPSRVIRRRGRIPLGVSSYPFATMCLINITEPVSPGVAFLCAAQNMAIVETWCFIAALPKANFQCAGTSLESLRSIGARRLARKRMNRMDNPRILGV